MPRQGTRTSTLSISLPRKLAAAISERVDGGYYTSASEVIREALRLLLKVEEAQSIQMVEPDPAAARFATTMQLFDLGTTLHEMKLRVGPGEPDPGRLRVWKQEQETGPGLRIAPERLARLKLP